MKPKTPRPPTNEPWVFLPRDVVRSDAWRSQSINVRRLIDCLHLEHMRHGGTANGKLKAPYRQLREFGIGARHVGPAIKEAEELGLVRAIRGSRRTASTYALTWMETCDGALATNDWREYRNPALAILSQPKNRNLPSEGKAKVPSEGNAKGGVLRSEGNAKAPKTLPSEGNAPSRITSYQGGDDTTDLSVGAARSRLRVVPGALP